MDKLLGKTEAAEVLSTSAKRLDCLRRAGAITAVQDGREWKYRASDIAAYIAELPTSA